jgi:hypothetical protein
MRLRILGGIVMVGCTARWPGSTWGARVAVGGGSGLVPPAGGPVLHPAALTVYMPDEPPETGYGQTMFRRVQDVLAAGGFGTFDLGSVNRRLGYRLPAGSTPRSNTGFFPGNH